MIFERNKRANEEVNIKPITQQSIPNEFYNPKSYLEPYKVKTERRDIKINSLHQTTVFNRKEASQPKYTKEVGKQDFIEMKKYSSETTMPNLTASSSLRNLTAVKTKEVPEFRSYISKNENEFYSSSKVFFKPTTSFNKYSFSTPDYFRVSARNESKCSAQSNVYIHSQDQLLRKLFNR